ncbi:non-ribosomal peptide synthetase [Streptomyces sp. PT12]|uniref:non-ribosomal peptide synthetase n=1 Tax=Streptomyces sp. PT12 TaxID=1510197 RepID=UPI000DE3799E|nr:non-ribosomal peptide synthetase [Streptomyces sp. PT12]RBM06847.1 non-ribosomal peptide synthetase [Streptomyces sp. PT12]
MNAPPTLDDVASALADVLDTPVAEMEFDTPLTELGLESFTAVRLRRRIREDLGLDLPLTAFLGSATVRSLVPNPAGAVGVAESQPGADGASFPLTPIQSAYWVGRDAAFPLGGVATFFYREYDREPGAEGPEADLARLTTAWNRLVARHPMLRMVVGPDARQRVLTTVPEYRIDVTDLRDVDAESAERAATRLRAGWSHQVRRADRWPLFDVRAVLLPDGRTRLCMGVDVLALDLAGWLQVLAEWGRLVAEPDAQLPPQQTTFADYVRGRERDPAERRRREADLAYWAERAPNLQPGPELPLAVDVAELRGHRFTRARTHLTADEWSALRDRAARHGLSPTGMLLAAFGLTLTRWGATEPFTLNTTLFDRPDVPELKGVVGDFTSTLLVGMPELDPLRWEGFAAYASQVNERFWTDMEHRAVSGMEAPQANGQPSGPPRHPVVFTSGLGLTDGDADPAGWLGTEVFGISQTPQILLDHIVYAEGGALILCWDSVDGAYPAGFVSGMLDAHARLLRRLAREDEAWRDPELGWDPSFLPAQTLDATPFGDAGPPLDDPARAAAEARPDAPALLDSADRVSHKELAARAERTAAVLAAAGVGPGDLVAVAAEKGPAQVAAILGVTASGAGYVPVEPSWPARRVASVCAQAGIRHALAGDGTAMTWPDGVTAHPLRPDGTPAAESGPESAGGRCRPKPDELAYVIFTSGSTGRPKGVAIEHRAARTTVDDLVDRFPIGPDDRVLALSAFSFDLSVYDVFAVLGVGGALVLPEVERQRDPAHWLELMARHRVTVWNTAPALMEMLVEYAEVAPDQARAALAPLRLVLLSGDWIPVTLPERVRALAPDARIVSLGGATEASIWSICHLVDRVEPEWRSIPYGRALRGQSFHILDPEGRPCPVGASGELHIGGRGLAREYVGDPEQTGQRFVVHPLLGTRLYRTGDLGRWRPDGTIEFLGRLDRQVKIRGHRIELGEVESVLDRLPGVRKSVALSVPGPDDRPRLVAYAVRHEGAEVTDEEIRSRLRENVPAYMVPSRLVAMAEFPVTDNGKIDYRALPNPYRRASDRPSAVPTTVPSAPVPTAVVAEEQAAVGASPLDRALRAAGERGLSVTLTLSAGTLPPADALIAAGECGRLLLSAATAAGFRPAERLTGRGLIELALGEPATTAESAVPSQDTAPSSPPAAPASERGPSGAPGASASPEPETRPETRPEVEAAVRRVFGELLRAAPTELAGDTPFFQLGATSLTLVQAQRRLGTELDPALSVVDLLSHPTVRGLAAVISARTARQPPPPPRAARAPAPPATGRRAARARAAELAR